MREVDEDRPALKSPTCPKAPIPRIIAGIVVLPKRGVVARRDCVWEGLCLTMHGRWAVDGGSDPAQLFTEGDRFGRSYSSWARPPLTAPVRESQPGRSRTLSRITE